MKNSNKQSQQTELYIKQLAKLATEKDPIIKTWFKILCKK